MNTQIPRLAAGLIACAVSTWAAADLPTYETYSAAADFGANFFSYSPTYTPLVDTTKTSGATAQISGAGYTASASATLGSNHAYASASAMPILGAGNFSGWYDQTTVTGGVGTGTAYFTVQLSGTVDVGQYGGRVAYGLYASSLHPTQFLNTVNIVDAVPPPTQPWALGAPLGFNSAPELATISSYLLGASPYNDTSILFSSTPYPPSGGIPAIPNPGPSLGGDAGMGFPTPDLILTPGSGQNVNITLHGTFNFTYGESFYLIGGLGMAIGGLEPFCQFSGVSTCTAHVKDGTGATTLDFSNSANLVSIVLPTGASASFASGASYNVSAVPEPAEWLMLLVGMGLIGWRARRI